MHNQSGMSDSTGSLFLTGDLSFQNESIHIYSGLIPFVSLRFSGTVTLFESMNMVLLTYDTAFQTVRTLTYLPTDNTVTRKQIQSHDNVFIGDAGIY